MKAIVAQACSVLVQLMSMGSALAHNLPADIRLLSLVPPESQIVADIVPTPKTRHQGTVVLFTLANRIDYEDFLSIAAADPMLQVNRLIFTASEVSSAGKAEHGVIVSGSLQSDRIYKSLGYPSGAHDYRGVAVLLVPPLRREGAYFQQERLLAIIGPHLAIFGTPSTVREEIDRFVNATEADRFVVQRVTLLNSEGDSWYLVRSPVRVAEFSRILTYLHSDLSEARSEGELLFGMRFRRQMEFRFVTNAVLNPKGKIDSHARVRGMFRDEDARSEPAVRVVKVARARFEKWLETVSGQ